jgi:hypothetical protein
MSPVSSGTGYGPCTSAMAHSHNDTSLTLESSIRRSSLERRSWNEAGLNPVMSTIFVVRKGSGMVLGSFVACTPATFVRPNGSWPHGERGGDSGVPQKVGGRSCAARRGPHPRRSLKGLCRACARCAAPAPQCQSQLAAHSRECLPRAIWRSGFLPETKRAKTIGNEIQVFEAEGLEGREDGRFPWPNVRGLGKLQ